MWCTLNKPGQSEGAVVVAQPEMPSGNLIIENSNNDNTQAHLTAVRLAAISSNGALQLYTASKLAGHGIVISQRKLIQKLLSDFDNFGACLFSVALGGCATRFW
jgi:hypothetical protein